jgi:hypothetical protein
MGLATVEGEVVDANDSGFEPQVIVTVTESGNCPGDVPKSGPDHAGPGTETTMPDTFSQSP